MVSNHVMDLIERYGDDGISVPTALTDYVKARKFYDYKDHSRVGAAHGEFVTDEICDRFCVHRLRRAVAREAAGARGGRRRPVQHLPDDARAGGDAAGVRRRHHPAVRGRRRVNRAANCARCSRCGRRCRCRSPSTARRCSSAPTSRERSSCTSCRRAGARCEQLTDFAEPVSGHFPSGRTDCSSRWTTAGTSARSLSARRASRAPSRSRSSSIRASTMRRRMSARRDAARVRDEPPQRPRLRRRRAGRCRAGRSGASR